MSETCLLCDKAYPSAALLQCDDALELLRNWYLHRPEGEAEGRPVCRSCVGTAIAMAVGFKQIFDRIRSEDVQIAETKKDVRE